MDILVNVSNQKLKVATNLKSLVSGTQEFIRFVFNLTGDWDGLLTYAQFIQEDKAYNQYLDDEKSVYLPSEIKPGICKVVLCGNNGTTIALTNYLTLIIDENIIISDASGTNISTSLYDQLVGKFKTLDSRLTAVIAIMDDETAGSQIEVLDIRAGYDGILYECAGDAVRAIGSEIALIKEELQQYVDAHAVDGLYYEGSMLYLTSNGEVVSDPVEIVSGGGGGSGGSSSVVRLVNNNDKTAFAISSGSDAILNFTFTSVEDEIPTGNGTLKITVGGATKLTKNIGQGANFINVKDYLSVGSNTVRVTCSDIYGMSRSIVYTITVVEISVSSTFDDTVTYNGDITFKYTPFGLIEKTVHILLDGTSIQSLTLTASGKQNTKIIPKQAHGVHRLEIYITASMDGSDMESNHLIYDIMCVDSDNTDAFIASPFVAGTVSQGEQVSIPYTVYDPITLESEIQLNIYTMENGVRTDYSSQTITVDRTRKNWVTRRYPVGTVYFEIFYPSKNISKTHTFTVTEAEIDVEAETNDLDFFLTSAGRSNDEENPATWENNNVTTTFENVNWSSSGWIEDENGDVALRLNGDARATINFKPFSKDLRVLGKTIELEFAIRDVNNRDAIVIDCMSGDIGIKATADTAWLNSEQSHVECRYKEDEKLRVSFVIESRSEYRMLAVYLNGVLSCAEQYPANDNFQQSTPVNISLGSQYCGIDLYNIRVYDTALSENSVAENYIADIADVATKVRVFGNNDIYDEYDNLSYEKIKPKIPVMTIIGTLPQSKGDKKTVTIIYEDPFHPELNFTDTCTIDVQGTSSQFYVRKNWKLKFPTEHRHAIGQLPAKVFCMKVDYAEATGTHNTQNANLVETLYSESFPAKEDIPNARTTIYGFPCVIFSQVDESSTPVFYGKSNFNYDKGAESVFGFTDAYDVECWEFCNNTSNACNFTGEIPSSWGDDFEARYPDGYKNINRFKIMHDWVVSTNQSAATNASLRSPVTIDGTQYTNDTAEYRLAKFKNEFEDYFDMHYSLIYYVYTFVALMVDQRAKNMFMTYWGDGVNKWYPYFYDNDTSFGINNEGKLVFDYYHEDTDKLDGANVYNGQDSTLWVNFREAFPDEIQETYQELRSSGKLTYDVLVDRFITQGSDAWSESIYNEDANFKYISMLHSDNDASNLYQVRGDGELHFKYFVNNRLQYCDSKWYAPAYADDIASLRIYTPSADDVEDEALAAKINASIAAVPPNADITVVSYSNMYAGVRYKANGTLQQERIAKNTTKTFEAPDETFNDTETAIYGVSNLSSLVDLAPLYCGTVNVAKATKLVNLKIGDSKNGYYNPNLTELSVGTNRLLKTIDIRNCPNLTSPLDLSGCPNIEEIYAEGSGLTGVELPESGYLKTMHLPNTITGLTIRNQEYLTDFSFTPNVLKTLRIENCPTIDVGTILKNASTLERARLINIEWTVDSESELQTAITKLKNCQGMNEVGDNIDGGAIVTGKVYVPSISANLLMEINEAFPLLIVYSNNEAQYIVRYLDWNNTVLYRAVVSEGDDAVNAVEAGYISAPTRTGTEDTGYVFKNFGTLPTNIHSNVSVIAQYAPAFRVRFMNEDVVYNTQWVESGQNATLPSTNPEKTDTAEFDYTFSKWSGTYTNITAPVDIVAVYTSVRRTYTVYFYNGNTLLYTAPNVPYGSTATYVGDTPVDPDGMEFEGWNPSNTNIQGDTSCKAVFASACEVAEISDDWSTIIASVNDGTYATKYKVGNYKALDLGSEGVVNMQIAGINKDALADGSGNAPITWISKELLTTNKRMNPALVGKKVVYAFEPDSTTATNAWKSTNQGKGNASCKGEWSITVVSDGVLNVRYKVSSEQSYDKLTVKVDGTIVANAISGESVDWAEYSVTCTAGQVVSVTADYTKDGSGDKGDDTAYIDFVSESEIEITQSIVSSSVPATEGTGSIGGWEKTEMRTYINDTIKPLIPEIVHNAIKEVIKTHPAYDTSETKVTQTTTDGVWLPSYDELFNTNRPYKALFPDNASRIKYKVGSTSASIWWLRSASYAGNFYRVHASGTSNGEDANRSNGVALGFCM